MSTRLQRIFIRAQDEHGKWGNVSLHDATDEQFDRWLGMWLRSRALGTREHAIEWLDDLGISPVELKEGYDD